MLRTLRQPLFRPCSRIRARDTQSYSLSRKYVCLAHDIGHYIDSFILTEKLRASTKYGDDKSIASISSCFNKTIKLMFRNPDDRYYVKFGTYRDTDRAFNIQGGKLTLPG
jgi:hypothetical protein